MSPGQLVRVARDDSRWRRPGRFVGTYTSATQGRCVVVADEEGASRFLPAGDVGPLCADCTTDIDRGRRRLRATCRFCFELREKEGGANGSSGSPRRGDVRGVGRG